eukprot:TRINITY_DN937_c0_g1_i2.p1 TRINITY_DN937_c0_g1~~TRINITY_DN937_c0_g1_i2.p1  ORF type:complete len:197 (+),score=47.41 TRINITY_DN937_c0_g1_i2:183-773(+)
MEIVDVARPARAVSATFTSTLCQFLKAIPHGVLAWSESVPNLVETSECLSIVQFPDPVAPASLKAVVFARSSHPTALQHVTQFLSSLATLYGGTSTVSGIDMPGWPAEPKSELAVAASKVFIDTTHTEPKVTSIHAGLECGIIMNKFPANKMQAISIGPTVKGAHTVDESLDVDSMCKLYHYLHNLIAYLAKPKTT